MAADAVTVLLPVLGIAALIFGAANDKLTLGLIVLIFALTVVVGLLVVRLRHAMQTEREARSLGPKLAAATAEIERLRQQAETVAAPYIPTAKHERDATRAVLQSLSTAIERFEYDNMHGASDAAAEARVAVHSATAQAQELSDDAARATVLAFADRLVETPPGWWREHGATKNQMWELRQAYEAAQNALGIVLRRT